MHTDSLHHSNKGRHYNAGYSSNVILPCLWVGSSHARCI